MQYQKEIGKGEYDVAIIKGGLQGLAHTVEQSGPKRGGIETPVRGLYRLGQYVGPGAGIVTCAICATEGAKRILKKDFHVARNPATS